MSAARKYQEVFGKMDSLSDESFWPAGLFSMAEHFVWDTKSVLGNSKKAFWKLILQCTKEAGFDKWSEAEQFKFIENALANHQAKTDVAEKYKKPVPGYCTAREALRRSRYFSEDYLNKEFDIFLSLCSDRYLDKLYSRFISFEKGKHWSTHGNSGYFSYSADIERMQIDNVAYNEGAGILIANELKLGGRKNSDQIIKYHLLHKELQKCGFVKKDCEFLLLFIGPRKEAFNLVDELRKEIAYCGAKEHLKPLLLDVQISANTINVQQMTWGELVVFNEVHMDTLDKIEQQVELKLLSGFNKTVLEKAVMRPNMDSQTDRE